MEKKISRRNCPIRLINGQSRYSENDLILFKERVISEIERAKKDYQLLESSITHSDSNGIEDTSPTFKVLEEGAITLSKEEIGNLAQRQKRRIEELSLALLRIENKTYGVLPNGGLIPPERLWAVPQATTLCRE